MNSTEDVTYRLDLATGFLAEADQDFQLGRWRSCVDNAQLSVENAGKAILALVGVPGKTHEPARHVAELAEDEGLPAEIRGRIKEALPHLVSLGTEEHFMTDYGDEQSYTLPWDMFTDESAVAALEAARACLPISTDVVRMVREWRSKDEL